MPWESKQTFFKQHVNIKDSKNFWKTIRLLNRDYSSNPTLLDGNGSLLNVAQQNSFVKNFFYSCFNHNCPPLTNAAQDLDFTHSSSVQVTALLSFFVKRSQF